jgi:hypothetical protein
VQTDKGSNAATILVAFLMIFSVCVQGIELSILFQKLRQREWL